MKNVMITGVSTGIGHHAADWLIRRGFRVFGSVRKTADADRLKESWGELFHPMIFDVTDGPAIENAASQVREALNGEVLSGLVNNAGMVVQGPLLHLDLDDFRYQLEVNVLGVVRVTQAFARMLGAQRNFVGTPGRIINIGSVSGVFATPFIAPYCTSKYGLEAISDCLRRELLIYDVDVIHLQIGPVTTPIWDKAREADWDQYQDTDYAPLIGLKDRIIKDSVNRAIHPDQVSERIYKCLTIPKPRARYLLIKNSLGFRFVSQIMPDRMVDRMFAKGMKSGDRFRPGV